MLDNKKLFERRKRRTRFKLRRTARPKPRLSVFRSNKHMYAQVIDDSVGKTLAFASTVEKGLRDNLQTGADTTAAAEVGKLIAERAKSSGIATVVFDRGGYLYHGRVKALGDAARDAGLGF